MNKKQKIALWLGIIIIVAMGTFPPWVISIQGAIQQRGYDFILIPPEEYCHINTSRLYVQWIMVVLITGGLLITIKSPRRR